MNVLAGHCTQLRRAVKWTAHSHKEKDLFTSQLVSESNKSSSFWPTLTWLWTLQLIRSGYYFTINQRRGREAALSPHHAALQSNCARASSVSRTINSSSGWMRTTVCPEPLHSPSKWAPSSRPPSRESQEWWLCRPGPALAPNLRFIIIFLWYLSWQLESLCEALKIKMWWVCDETLEEVTELLNWHVGTVGGQRRQY